MSPKVTGMTQGFYNKGCRYGALTKSAVVDADVPPRCMTTQSVRRLIFTMLSISFIANSDSRFILLQCRTKIDLFASRMDGDIMAMRKRLTAFLTMKQRLKD